jgi:hypothetical protein
VFRGDVGEHVFGWSDAAVTGGGEAFLDAGDLPGLRVEILAKRVVDDLVA